MQLSVIIVHYNTFDLTRDCIASVYDTTKGLDFEVILVNNSDTDRSITDLQSDFPNLRIVSPGSNLGFAKGNNFGIGHATGETILLLNSDTIINENSLISSYAKLAADKKIGAITCQLRYPNGELQHNCQPFPSTKKEWLEKLRLHKLFPGKKRSDFFQGFYFDYSKDGNPDWIWGTYFMFRKELLQHLPDGKLNDDYFMYMEDMQWCWDIRKAGYKIAYDSEAYIIHIFGGSNAGKEKLMAESRDIFRKNTGL